MARYAIRTNNQKHNKRKKGIKKMYIIFRCDCGRILYTKHYKKTKKCPQCNRTLQIKNRRILKKTENINTAIQYTQQEQNRIYHNTGFTTANNIKK